MLKSRAIIDTKSDNDTDIYVPGIREKYAARPKSLCTISLAEFVANYSDKSYSTSDTTMEEDEVTVDMLSSTVDLLGGQGKISTRRKNP
ncbi:hypothetical protein DPMN_097965 [Dreissena polymorpha]|uniref:Uncharacterized protein n=1 Tax=Dreissena polymorpha TaxID=45954 RepID=A0A9D4LBF7_DREPO|nr:hypothetical protein DPMN_097965 [Dreissena polymorpha]